MQFEKLDFEYTDDVTVINREQFDVHMRLYEGYINKMNEIDALLMNNPGLKEANATYSKFRGIKRGETYALDGVILHEFYFENIGSPNNTPDADIRQLLSKDYGSFEEWQEHFVATAKASRGWVVLCYDPRSDRFRNISLDAHDYGNIAMSIPLLVLDMYEHAYFLQYADNKVEYIERFMDNIDWQVVKDRMQILQ
ncbi:superoxide dismutase [Anaerocolumna cellulosilytica]|uniref:superoxide dismutase n=1 Tax=Anaerocolumna cellulosilytica TaxID=433286 RepID=A0A6S6R1C6_9FIRM|nr:Fe-Mn family superoxide dismutase [Anaerocolumna cellulosilytica]MBB5197614.1 Fe-Mn family superoxide dismutase [Anaerocolumna cellulosilytica]BCJ95139.1 superoxide dismutase [Anaerocolumna cellulosilytica]